MAQNYFTDIVGGTQQAFQRGQQAVESARQQIGQNQAARALARGDTRAAREAYGRAGMVEQVDVLGQREAAQTEAMRKQKEQAEALAYTRQQDADKMARQAAADKLQYLGNVSQALLQIPKEQRAQALSMFGNTFQAMGLPPETISQLSQQDLSDENLRMFGTAMGEKVAEVQLPSTMGAIPTGYMYDPETGELRPVPGGPKAAPSVATAAAAPRASEGAPEGLSKDIRTQATSLRKEFNARPEVKDYRSKSSSVANMRVFAKRASPASDMSMIFLFMKMLDPTSVVREGEYANAQNATSIPERIRNQYNKAINGTGLNPRQRQDFLSQAESILLNAETSYQMAQAEYADYARLSGVPKELLFGEQARTPAAPRQGAFLLRPGEPNAPPPSPLARATGSRANPPPYATAEERELWSVMTAEEKAAVWDEGK